MASCLHPKFRFDWLPNEKKIGVERKLKELFIKKFCSIDDLNAKYNQLKNDTSTKDDFYTFKIKETNSNHLDEFYSYQDNVKSKSKLLVLDQFPKIRKLFVQFNTGLPSSASVERLFNSAALILREKRNRLGDETFEILIKLKPNKSYY